MLTEKLRTSHNHLMTLREFLDALPRGGVADFASKLGISSVYLSQLASRQDGREPSAELCVLIERESGGKVTRPELRTNWKEIWPELASKKERK